MITAKLWEHLKLTVPSVNDRVFANLMAENTPKPALVYTVVKELVRVNMGGACSSDRNFRTWEITAYAEGYAQNKSIKDEVVSALKTFEYDVTGIEIEDGFDTQSELYAQHITFNTGKR